MKVLNINTLYHPGVTGGAEMSLRYIAEALIARGVEAAVVCTAPEAGIERYETGGVRVHRVGLRNLYWPLGDKPNPSLLKPLWHLIDTHNVVMARAAGRIMDEERPDIVHTANLLGFSTLVWGEARRRRIPVVHTIRDHALICPGEGMFRDGAQCDAPCWRCRPFGAPRRARSGSVDAVIGVSRFILERHLALGYFRGARRREVIADPLEPGRPAGRAPADRPGTPIAIGCLGRLHPSKGTEVVLDALRLLPPGRARLVMAGKGPADYEAALRRRGDAGVEWAGFVARDEVLSRVDVVVAPSLLPESLGRTIFEANACGVPAIASASGAHREIVAEGENGWLVPPGDPAALARRIEGIIAEPGVLGRMRGACLEAAARFEPGPIAAAHEALYEAVGRDASAARAASR